MGEQNKLVVFEDKKIRRVWHEDEWYFVLEDVVNVLIESKDPKQYINRMRQRDPHLSEGWVQLVHTLGVSTTGGSQKMNCVNTESAFRIIQSIPSKKAEPFKRWLAKVGHERVKEIENPELAQDRAKKYYELKGYPKNWIDKRIRGIAIRQEFTEEWQRRGVEQGREFALLTDEISKATFGVSTKEHKDLKGLEQKYKNQNLRDHMNDLELIFNMVGEASTTEITKIDNSQGFQQNKQSAQEGGSIAGNARRALEKRLDKPVVSPDNFLELEKEKLTHKKKPKVS